MHRSIKAFPGGFFISRVLTSDTALNILRVYAADVVSNMPQAVSDLMTAMRLKRIDPNPSSLSIR